ncbi:MAG: biosynthetic peptidoglycan transglycosylase [Saezia sp.]
MTQTIAPIPTGKKARWRWLKRLAALCVFLVMMLISAAIYIYQTQLKPDSSDEWAYPLEIKGVSFPLSISKSILWTSSARIGPWLDGITKSSSHGQYQLRWDAPSQSLVILCRQCTNRVQGLGADGLVLDFVALYIHQDKDQNLSGQVVLGETLPIALSWSGRFSSSALQMNIAGKSIPISSIYHNVTPELSELKYAQITGTMDISAQAQFPGLHFSLSHIKTSNFTVSGLGTEQLIHSTSKCGSPANLPMDHWLVRSVMSAEDQRFETHPGYDLEELATAFGQNHSSRSIIRGGSTITQQTAKLLYTGSEKSLARKMRELLYAVEMEQTLGKARIMQLYLDNAPWGLDREGKFICGAQTAAREYFGLDAKDLRPHQAVWLAAMLHSPIREAKTWQETGKINLERAIWIARYVRNARNSGPRARQKVIDALKRDPSLGMRAPLN